MSATITASQANQQFSRLLQRVREGEVITVTSRGRPVAELRPIVEGGREERRRKLDELTRFLAEQPVRYTGPWTRDELYD